MDEKKKNKIVGELRRLYPCDLSIGEVSKRVHMSDPTVSTYLKVLEAERKIEISRKVGNAVFYRLNKGSKVTNRVASQ